MLASIALLAAQQGAFFEKPQVDFWNRRPKAEAKTGADPLADPDVRLPEAVRGLLERPSLDAARRYLAWQRKRFERFREALRMIELALKEEKDARGSDPRGRPGSR